MVIISYVDNLNSQDQIKATIVKILTKIAREDPFAINITMLHYNYWRWIDACVK